MKIFFLCLLSIVTLGGELHAGEVPMVTVSVETNHRTGGFDPRKAFGAGIDGHEQGDCQRMLSPESVKQMLAADLGPVSYRLRTELAVEAWHWNPRGVWSDPQRQQGYWTSDAKPDSEHPVLLSYGYKLPRRGDTLDEANDDGYSRLDDGDPKTFWKSNPYLCQPYTGAPDSRHPQWVVLDFGKTVPINAMRIQWAEPYATSFRVEYATKGRVYYGGHPGGALSPVWRSFPHGVIGHGTGGDQFLRLAERPVKARYLRVWMTKGSGTAFPGAHDSRDHLGYAIREVAAGEAGRFDFDDHVIHSPDKKQTITYASSTDPWHRACDRDPKVEQPGIDLLMHCGITRGLPMMLAIPVLYDTPENAAGYAAYVHQSRIPVNRYELGEEPDGQRIDPKDFGALYAQVGGKVRKAVPGAVMGGPSFVTLDVESGDDQTYRFDKRWWIRDFLGEITRHGQAKDFRFLSFEWYPFDEVDGKESEQAPRASVMLDRTLHSMRCFHLPLVIGEYNYSVFPCRQEVDLSGGLLNAEIAAHFLCGGGDAVYYYGYEPNRLENTCGSWGNQLMLLNREASLTPVATFHTLRLLTREWMDPRGGPHGVLPLTLRGCSHQLEGWALCRPDHSRSLLLINKADHSVTVVVHGMQADTLHSYGQGQYRWHAEGADGHPERNLPPSSLRLRADQPILIPPLSVSVIR
jgi:F5/8 type C domain